MYFRLTPLGAYCLDVETDYQPAPMEVKPVLRVCRTWRSRRPAQISSRATVWPWTLTPSPFRTSSGVWNPATIRRHRGRQATRGNPRIPGGAKRYALPDTVARLLDDVAGRTTRSKTGDSPA